MRCVCSVPIHCPRVPWLLKLQQQRLFLEQNFVRREAMAEEERSSRMVDASVRDYGL